LNTPQAVKKDAEGEEPLFGERSRTSWQRGTGQ
jgi:hypothetical protein